MADPLPPLPYRSLEVRGHVMIYAEIPVDGGEIA